MMHHLSPVMTQKHRSVAPQQRWLPPAKPQGSAGLRVPQAGEPGSRSGSSSAGCTTAPSSRRSLWLWAKAVADVLLLGHSGTVPSQGETRQFRDSLLRALQAPLLASCLLLRAPPLLVGPALRSWVQRSAGTDSRHTAFFLRVALPKASALWLRFPPALQGQVQ